MKKQLAVSILLCFLLSMLPVGAAGPDGVYDAVCPLNTAVELVRQDDRTLVALTMFNATAHPISYVEYSLYLFDGDGEPATDGSSHYFYAYADDLRLQPLSAVTLHWDADAYKNAAEIRSLSVKKVTFAGGETWTAPDTLFSQAFLYANNAKTEDGRYIKNEAGELVLVDYSYSSHSRVWYYWDDSYGWVPFSRDIIARLTPKASAHAVKLEINGDPNLYSMDYFMLAQTPGTVNMHPYATGETHAVSPAKLSSPSEAVPTFDAAFTVDSGLPVGDVPLLVGLWDHGDAEDRIWSIWDGTVWVDFSYERGPLCEIWRTGRIYLRLSYGDSAAIYALEVEGV
ncbi:MAG: hypothetical protein E7408_05640 [Ruminococcaceae bacterium]|nr:hypothetical protein [Oscillospiraceae bacterium]